MAGVSETRDRISKLLMGSQNASQDMCDRCATGVRPCATGVRWVAIWLWEVMDYIVTKGDASEEIITIDQSANGR